VSPFFKSNPDFLTDISTLFREHPVPTLLVKSSNYNIVGANKAAYSLFKRSKDALLQQSFNNLVDGVDKIKVLQYLKSEQHATVWNDIFQLQVGSDIIIAEAYGSIFKDGDDTIHQVALLDCTKEYHDQEQNKCLNQRYRDFIEQSTEGIFLHEFPHPVSVTVSDQTFIAFLREHSFITECNTALAQMYGFETPAELNGRPSIDFFNFEDPGNIAFLLQFKKNGFQIIDTESYEIDRFGKPHYFLNNLIGVVEDGYLKRIWGTQREITEQKETEKKVRLLASLVEQTSDVLTLSDMEFKPLTWNKAAEKIYGLTAEQVIGRDIRSYIDISYQNGTSEEVKAIVNKTGEWRGEMYFIRNTDNEPITLLASYKLLKDYDDTPLGYVIAGTDITERKKIEKQIRLFANLVEGTSDVLIGIDLEFKTISWNEAAANLTGLTAKQTMGKIIREYLDIQYVGMHYEEVRNLIKAKGEWRGEMYFNRPTDGQKITLLATYKLFKDENGHPAGFVVACKDISARKEAELKLLESESRFREVADSAPVMIWMVDQESKTIYANQPFLNFTGLDWKTYINGKWSSIIHPDDIPIAIYKFNQFFAKKEPITLIYRIKNKEGKYRWVQDSSIPRFLADKTFLGYIGSIIDIHNTKEKEEQFRYQATVLENALDSIITTDLLFIVKTWNKIAEQFFGFSEKDAIGKKYSDLVILDFLNHSSNNAIEQLRLHGLWKGEVSYVNKWGEVRYFMHTLTYVYNEDGYRISIMAVSRDITERKRAEEKLKQSEQFYRSLISDSLDGMILTNVQGIVKFVSPSVKHSLGYSVDDLLYKNAFQYVHPEDRKHAMEAFQKEIDSDSGINFVVIRLQKKDGQWLWCMVRAQNLLNNPYVQSIVIYFHDDTLRKEATTALEESEQRFRALVHDLQVGVLLQDAEGKILMANKIILETLQKKEEDLKGKIMVDIVRNAVKEDGTQFSNKERPLHQVLQLKKPIHGTVMGINDVKTGDRIWMMLNLNPIFDDAGELIHIITSFIDITERKKLEAKLWQEEVNHQRQLTQATIDGQEKERREIGKELHDNIGQQLTTTKLYLDLAKSTAEGPVLQMIEQTLKSIIELINEVRNISRTLMPPTLGDLGLLDCITDLTETLSRTQAILIQFAHVDINEHLIPDNQKLMLFRIIQEQLNNIVKHAKAKLVTIDLYKIKDNLVLEVKDDGLGFNMQTVRKGLGLTNIKNRAELFGGQVQIFSSEGKGCLLKITIPDAS
jgi:PAS domain S-box-containing protein